MTDNVIENNQVTIMGEIVSDMILSHITYGEKWYLFNLGIDRLSDSKDIIPVMVSEKFLNDYALYKGMFVCISGNFRSYNKIEEGKHKLLLSVLLKDLEVIDYLEVSAMTNQIYLDGFICKKPIFRKTPLGREITDLLVAVNRPYGRSDYIPCICWGRNAKLVSEWKVGSRCAIWGRIQSRVYLKKMVGEQTEKRVAYEVSVNKLEIHE